MKISIGADHRGFKLKQHIIKIITSIDWLDVGTNSDERTDYPVFAKKVVKTIQEKTAQQGVLLCHTGIGMSIAANRFKGIYAALCWSTTIAIKAKEDDNANIIVIPAGFVDFENVEEILLSWMNATFKEGKYQERLKLIDNM
jgi:ribose 5-phosphate isomerase B